jgi:hypothetical protein
MIPAYGRELIALRDRGAHPDLVVICYASRFAVQRAREFAARLDAPHPLIATDDQVRFGSIGWWLLRGLGAAVLNAEGARAHVPTFSRLVADVAREAAPVLVFHDQHGGHWGSDASEFLWCQRFTAHAPDGWPAGWSDELDQGYLARLRRRAEA